jgi:hypothetical protein
MQEPFYVGIGFTSHQPATLSAARLSDVVLESEARFAFRERNGPVDHFERRTP